MKVENNERVLIKEVVKETSTSLQKEQPVKETATKAPPAKEMKREVFRREIIDEEKIKEAQEQLQEEIERLKSVVHIFDRRYNFHIHERTNRIFVQVIDVETDTVIREIPPEKILNLIASIHHMMGLFFDGRI